MSDIKLVSPMLDNFVIGEAISDHNGIRCCPAMQKDSDEKYIVKIISVPASQVQYDALLLTGICSDRESALAYFNDLANGIVDEIKALQKLSNLEGFLPIENYQIVPMEDDVGYDIYILSKYRRTLTKQFKRQAMTHLGAVNLGLDLCAALSVCRKLGYLYADLKPSNVYIPGEQEYRIGDIGFVKLDSLKYASLPEAYHSAYTAPEITDAYSALNTTIDIYALGLILYQAYNDGVLPVADKETGEISPPAYADYEMSEIILKACATSPEDRWQDPIEIGQALVAYMQRNGANDTPIVPFIPAKNDDEIPVQEQALPDNENVPELSQEEQTSVPYSEDALGNLSFLDDSQDDSAPSDEDADVAYDEVTEEVSDMMAVADELISHPTPDPVVAPEAIDVPIPTPVELLTEPTVSDEETAEETNEDTQAEAEESAEEEISKEDAVLENDVSTDDVTEDESASDEITEAPSAPKKKSSWWKGLLIALLITGIGVAGYFYYTLCYLKPVSMELSGHDSKLTVSVYCAVEDLFVTCTDAYGNQHKEPVIGGKAEFDKLASNTTYTVTVGTDKFYKLTGKTTASYHTEIQTEIFHFTAANGDEAGSVILNFTVEGTDSEQWCLYYAQTGSAEETVTFSGHMITLSNLNIGNQYTFRLEPVSDLFFEPENTITFTPSNPVQAENLFVSDYTADSLTVSWNAPENTTVAKWIVRCYDSISYSKTVETSELSATFEGIQPQNPYTIEVIAENMSAATKITAAEGLLSLKDFNVIPNDGMLTLTWDASVDIENIGWTVSCSIAGTSAQELKVTSGNKCESIPYVPNVSYVFTVNASDGRTTINNQYNYTSDAAPSFKNYGVGAEHIRFDMCKTPDKQNWTVRDLASSDFTTEFSANGKASFLLSIPYAYDEPDDATTITYVIYDENGGYVSSAVKNDIWSAMWDRGYCELDIPSIPTNTGNYRIAILFNGAVVNDSSFTIIA